MHPEHEVRIAVVGKYMKHRDAYKSVYESLDHAGIANRARVIVVRVEAEEVERRGAEALLGGVDGILVPGGFGMRGIEGKIEAIRYARTNRHSRTSASAWACSARSIEFARSVLGLEDANSTEFDKTTDHPVIALMEDQRSRRAARRDDAAGRLALRARARTAWPARPTASTRSASGTATATSSTTPIARRSRSMAWSPRACSPDGNLVEIIELPDHPWFLAVQFHPEFKSKPTRAHPLFRDFVGAALQRRGTIRGSLGAGRKSRGIVNLAADLTRRARDGDRRSRWNNLGVERNRNRRPVRSPRFARPGPTTLDEGDLWAAPAFWDIQINGRWGHSFSSPDLTVEQVAEIVRAQAALGTARLCPTLITAPSEAMRHGVRTIAAALRGLSRRGADGPGHSPGRPVSLGARRLSQGAPERGHPRSRLGPLRATSGGIEVSESSS